MGYTEYRIITEDLNRDKIIELISGYYSGFSITENTGFWNHEIYRDFVELRKIVKPGENKRTRLACAGRSATNL